MLCQVQKNHKEQHLNSVFFERFFFIENYYLFEFLASLDKSKISCTFNNRYTLYNLNQFSEISVSLQSIKNTVAIFFYNLNWCMNTVKYQFFVLYAIQ